MAPKGMGGGWAAPTHPLYCPPHPGGPLSAGGVGVGGVLTIVSPRACSGGCAGWLRGREPTPFPAAAPPPRRGGRTRVGVALPPAGSPPWRSGGLSGVCPPPVTWGTPPCVCLGGGDTDPGPIEGQLGGRVLRGGWMGALGVMSRMGGGATSGLVPVSPTLRPRRCQPRADRHRGGVCPPPQSGLRNAGGFGEGAVRCLLGVATSASPVVPRLQSPPAPPPTVARGPSWRLQGRENGAKTPKFGGGSAQWHRCRWGGCRDTPGPPAAPGDAVTGHR